LRNLHVKDNQVKNGSPAETFIPNQRHLFEIPEDVTYLNCANRSPQMISVRRAGEMALQRNSEPWKYGSVEWFTESEELRGLFGHIINSDAEGIALVPATSYGLAVAANNLVAKRGDRILLIDDDFPSNVYTWRAFAGRTGAEIVTVCKNESQTFTDAILESMDERVRIVAVPNVQWTNGELVELDKVGERAREIGATFIIDASQSLGSMSIDVSVLRPDFLVSVGYKWQLGPLSVSYLYVDERHRDGEPIENNWILRAGSEDFSRLVDYEDRYQPGARRFDVGQRSNFTLLPMSIAALRQLLDWKIESIAATLATLTDYIEQKADDLGLKATPRNERCGHLIGIELPGMDLSRVASALSEKQVYVSVRGSSIRVAPHLYNTEADIDRFFEVLKARL
jgi:selenocysteine lyase/cysteine desulfurase